MTTIRIHRDPETGAWWARLRAGGRTHFLRGYTYHEVRERADRLRAPISPVSASEVQEVA